MKIAPLIVFFALLSVHCYATDRKPLGPAEFYWLMDRACASGEELSVQFLLDAGADPTGLDYAAFYKKHRTAFEPMPHLCPVAWNGHTEIIRMLLKAGANPNLCDGEGWTPLTIAAEKGYLEIVRLLLDAGADKGSKPGTMTALEIALKHDRKDIADLIRQHK